MDVIFIALPQVNDDTTDSHPPSSVVVGALALRPMCSLGCAVFMFVQTVHGVVYPLLSFYLFPGHKTGSYFVTLK